MTFTHHKVLTYGSADSDGKRPNREWIGRSFFHVKTRRIYRVSGFVWNSTTDTWNVKYSRAGCDIEFTRVLAEFTEPRYVLIESGQDGNGDDD